MISDLGDKEYEAQYDSLIARYEGFEIIGKHPEIETEEVFHPGQIIEMSIRVVDKQAA